MTTVIQRLRLLEYEAPTDTGVFVVPGEGPVLDDEDVTRLLLGAPALAEHDRVVNPAAAIESAGEADALSAMRGVMIGLALSTPFWALVAAITLLA